MLEENQEITLTFSDEPYNHWPSSTLQRVYILLGKYFNNIPFMLPNYKASLHVFT